MLIWMILAVLSAAFLFGIMMVLVELVEAVCELDDRLYEIKNRMK